MWYAIISEDVENSSPLRKIHRPAHVERLTALNQQNRLLAAGPLPINDQDPKGEKGMSGSLVIANFDSLENAKKWADADPYLLNKVYKTSNIKPFTRVFPNE
jgi:uncharacterized protein YciI